MRRRRRSSARSGSFGAEPRRSRIQRLVEMAQAVRTSRKFEGLVKLIAGEEKDEKILIFTQFRRTLEYLEEGSARCG